MRQVYTQEQKDLIRNLRYVEKLSYREIAKYVTGDATKESSIRRILSSFTENDCPGINQEKTSLLTHDELETVAALNGKIPADEVAKDFGVPASIVRRIWDGMIIQGIAPLELTSMDKDSRLYYDKLSKTTQRQRDLLRVERKHTRESNRVVTMLEELTTELLNVLDQHRPKDLIKKHKSVEGSPVGIVHLTDIHFNEEVELPSNRYNFRMASARIREHIETSKKHFKACGVTDVLVALSGDLLNSDRRLCELTMNATNRSKAVFLAYEILRSAILDLNQDFNVSVASVCGNESRVNKELGFAQPVASENYDYTIFNMLAVNLKSDGIRFNTSDDPSEVVVNVNGQNILIMHGHCGLGRDLTTGVAKAKARYVDIGVNIRYVIFGHIHEAYVSDQFSRGGSPVGNNDYSAKGLGLSGRASQNCHIVYENGKIDSIKVDLQAVSENSGYDIHEHLEAYNSKAHSKLVPEKVIFQVVV